MRIPTVPLARRQQRRFLFLPKSQLRTMLGIEQNLMHQAGKGTEVTSVFNYVIIFKVDMLVAHWGG